MLLHYDLQHYMMFPLHAVSDKHQAALIQNRLFSLVKLRYYMEEGA